MQLSLFEWIGIRLAAELMDDSKYHPIFVTPFQVSSVLWLHTEGLSEQSLPGSRGTNGKDHGRKSLDRPNIVTFMETWNYVMVRNFSLVVI